MYTISLKFEYDTQVIISEAPYGVIEDAVDTARELENDGSLTDEEFELECAYEVIRILIDNGYNAEFGADITFRMD